MSHSPSFRSYKSAPRREVLARVWTVLALMVAILAPLFTARPAFASTITTAAFTGGPGTINVSSVLYAKQGGALTLTVTTSSDTKCVEVSGAHVARQTSDTAKTNWSFSFTAGAGNGVQSVSIVARPSYNTNNCTGSPGQDAASYVLDNTGPVVTGSLSPAANGAGWNNSNVAITWSATDAGSGIASGPTPAADSQTANTAGVVRTATATDRLGNLGSGSVTIKLDKDAPIITGSRSPAANVNGWNNTDVMVSFTCSDPLAGIQSCSGPTTLSNSAGNQSVTGTAVDNADNSQSELVNNINIDKVPPTLSGAPTAAANAAGWYNGDVTIQWTCSDPLSGVDGACPAPSTISSEGSGLTAIASVSDRAGNSTTAASNPAIQIDKTPPNTTATAPADWNNVDVTVSLNPADVLSGVAATYYRLNGGAQQSGTQVGINTEGIHTLEFWSMDNAGNVEAAKTLQIKIDKTPPTINHTQAPAANDYGWNNSDVTVTFICADGLAGSGIASCTVPQTVSTEGQNQAVIGTATDNAGNTATDPAMVSIDKTPPVISADADRPANDKGWYNDDVTVSFTCDDALAGVAGCPPSQTLGEGANQSANGTATDAAGNSAGAEVSGINVDKTPPALAGAPTTAPNSNGWYSGDVIVHWTCSDALSGIAGSCPADGTITGEGNNLATNASVSDQAGNTTSSSVSSIQIDRTAPSTLVSVPEPLISGWYAGNVEVTFTTGPDLSGIDKTYYKVDGGNTQEYSDPFTYGLPGVHTITFWSVDKAGNVEDATAAGHSITLKIDDILPTITGSRLPMPNASGWNNTEVVVSFACNDAESGIASCTDPVTLNDEGAAQSVTGHAVDNAGNSNSTVVDGINIDLTPPTVEIVVNGQPVVEGAVFNVGAPLPTCTAYDELSGIDPGGPSIASVTATPDGSNTHLYLPLLGNDQQTSMASSLAVPATSSSPCIVNGFDSSLLTTGTNRQGTMSATASDMAGNMRTVVVNYTVVDPTPPVIEYTLAPASPDGLNGWYKGNVSLAWSISEPESPNSLEKTGCDNQAITTDQAETTYLCSATSAGGQAGPVEVNVKRDATPPVVSVTGVTNGTTYTLGSVPAASCSTTDSQSGVATAASLSTSGGPVGSVKVTCSGGTDNAGNTASASLTYNVQYAWTGFFQPIDNGALNRVKGGSAVPVKFSLGGNQGLNIFAAGFPKSGVIVCNANAPVDTIEETVTAGSSTLAYDAASGQYIYVWKTDKTWTNGCRQLVLQLSDGTTRTAIFQFAK